MRHHLTLYTASLALLLMACHQRPTEKERAEAERAAARLANRDEALRLMQEQWRSHPHDGDWSQELERLAKGGPDLVDATLGPTAEHLARSAAEAVRPGTEQDRFKLDEMARSTGRLVRDAVSATRKTLGEEAAQIVARSLGQRISIAFDEGYDPNFQLDLDRGGPDEDRFLAAVSLFRTTVEGSLDGYIMPPVRETRAMRRASAR